MSNMGPNAKALLDAARDGDEPTLADDARMRRVLGAQLGVGLAVAASTTATASAAAAGAAGGAAAVAASSVGALLIKGAVVVALVGSIGAGVSVYTSRSATRPQEPTAAATAPERPLAIAAPAPVSGGAKAGEPESLATSTTRTAKPAAARPVPRAVAESASTLDDETRLVREADAARRGGDAARALLLLDQHARTFPNGVLAEERAAERVLVLCALGRSIDARVAADRFLRDRPRSPLANRVRSSCGAP